ncbi:alpha/beta fold hydrolase [Zavarzinia sp. CC-PAN008]|uniref:alpha/beta fold hydrolase n=1 Tax=Zavarzinia sp. CC-PAN008 TaxID=3243332 RepID=UPI003F749974
MPQVKANGITIEYESFGAETAPPVLLIMGFSGQMTMWPVELCHELVARGYRVIRFDNRDIGLSEKLDGMGVPDMGKMMGALQSGSKVEAPYQLEDMAADAVGLLTALGIDKAHIVGASMGGMIAQLVAAEFPDRVLSLTSIMSTTGNPALPPAKPEAMGALLAPRAPDGDWDAIVERGLLSWRAIRSPGFFDDEALVREKILSDARRSYQAGGVVRQMAAIWANGDRRPKLARITAPTVVLHGGDDPLVPVEGGKDTAANIAGAELRIIPGMAHDFPLKLVGVFADAVDAAVAKSRTAKAAE